MTVPVTDLRVREIIRLAQSMRRDHAECLAACAVIEPAVDSGS